jgi:hypothetical protein
VFRSSLPSNLVDAEFGAFCTIQDEWYFLNMSSKSRSDDGEQESRSEADSPVKAEDNVAQSTKPAAKRRTKTGCLSEYAQSV